MKYFNCEDFREQEEDPDDLESAGELAILMEYTFD
jgi:hypothetical protein